LITVYITLTFCCTKLEGRYLSRAAKLICGDPTPFVALLCSFEPYFYYKND